MVVYNQKIAFNHHISPLNCTPLKKLIESENICFTPPIRFSDTLAENKFYSTLCCSAINGVELSKNILVKICSPNGLAAKLRGASKGDDCTIYGGGAGWLAFSLSPSRLFRTTLPAAVYMCDNLNKEGVQMESPKGVCIKRLK